MNQEDTILKALDEIQKIKWLIDEGPAHVKLTEAQVRLTELKDSLSTIDTDAIRQECANKAIGWLKQLHHDPEPGLPWSGKLKRIQDLQKETLRAAIMGKEAGE